MKIITIVGARPQFIKAAALSRELSKHSHIEEIIVHTGQHFDKNMSDVFFAEMDIPKPDYKLEINSLSHGAMTGRMLEEMEKVFLAEKPDWVLVYGDTNSTLAGALAAGKLHFKVAHIEAGLRSFNMKMPEEINRVLTDRISNILFCPTETAVKNLQKEGFETLPVKIVKSGDIMYDAALFYAARMQKPNIQLPSRYALATIHRAENTDSPHRLAAIFRALRHIAETTHVVLPLHPRTKKYLKKLNINTGKIHIIEPVGYLEIIFLLRHCEKVLTDSGGLQKEAFFFKKPCLTLREETEWVELVEHNFNRLVGAGYDKIVDAFENHSFNTDYAIDLFGNGKTAALIVAELQKG